MHTVSLLVPDHLLSLDLQGHSATTPDLLYTSSTLKANIASVEFFLSMNCCSLVISSIRNQASTLTFFKFGVAVARV